MCTSDFVEISRYSKTVFNVPNRSFFYICILLLNIQVVFMQVLEKGILLLLFSERRMASVPFYCLPVAPLMCFC